MAVAPDSSRENCVRNCFIGGPFGWKRNTITLKLDRVFNLD